MLSRFICVKPYGASIIQNTPLREGTLARGSVLKEQRFPSIIFFLEQRPVSSSLSLRKSRHTASTKISRPSAKHVNHLGRRSSYFPSFPHVLADKSLPASRADLVRADPLKPQVVYTLERSSRMGERSRIKGAVPVGRVEGKDAIPESVPIEEDFAGEEPEPYAGDFRDRLVSKTRQVGTSTSFKRSFQDFLWQKDFEFWVCRKKITTIRSAVKLSQRNPGPDAPFRGNFRSAVGEKTFLRCPTISQMPNQGLPRRLS